MLDLFLFWVQNDHFELILRKQGGLGIPFDYLGLSILSFRFLLHERRDENLYKTMIN